MIKKLALLVTAIAVMAAFVAPLAHAEKPVPILMGGKQLTKNEKATLSGTASFTGSLGGVSCAVTSEVEFGPGSTGTVLNFKVPNPAGCTLSGGLKLVCTSLTSATFNTPFVIHGTELASGKRVLTITEVKFSNVFAGGGLCPGTLSVGPGTITATPNSETSISSVALSGTLPSGSGNLTVSGTLNVAPAGTYALR
jgi:hypothetical protein